MGELGHSRSITTIFLINSFSNNIILNWRGSHWKEHNKINTNRLRHGSSIYTGMCLCVCVRHIQFQFSFINFNLRILKKKDEKKISLTWLCRYVVMPSACASAVTLSLSTPNCVKRQAKKKKIARQTNNKYRIDEFFVKQSAWCYLLTDVSTSSVLLFCLCPFRLWPNCAYRLLMHANVFQQKKIFCAQSSLMCCIKCLQTHLTTWHIHWICCCDARSHTQHSREYKFVFRFVIAIKRQ